MITIYGSKIYTVCMWHPIDAEDGALPQGVSRLRRVPLGSGRGSPTGLAHRPGGANPEIRAWRR